MFTFAALIQINSKNPITMPPNALTPSSGHDATATPSSSDANPSTATTTNVLEGPDLNPSRSPFDKKVYKQILLPNGLRVVLISDTVAMTQSYNAGGIYEHDGDDDDDDESIDDGDDNDDDDDDHSTESEAGGLRNAAAAMVVGVGTFFDPPECQGLAHFLEHLLFMGSKKYPEGA